MALYRNIAGLDNQVGLITFNPYNPANTTPYTPPTVVETGVPLPTYPPYVPPTIIETGVPLPTGGPTGIDPGQIAHDVEVAAQAIQAAMVGVYDNIIALTSF